MMAITSAVAPSGSVRFSPAFAFHQGSSRVERVFPRRIHQGRPVSERENVLPRAAIRGFLQGRAGIDWSTPRDQNADGVAVILRRGPHQRGLAIPLIPRVHFGAAIEKQRKGFGGPRSRGGHQDGFTLGKNRVGIRSGVEQIANHGGVAVNGSQVQRRHSVAVGAFRIGARAEKQAGHFRIVRFDGPMQRCRAIGFGNVHGGPLLEQPPYSVANRPSSRPRAARCRPHGPAPPTRAQSQAQP